MKRFRLFGIGPEGYLTPSLPSTSSSSSLSNGHPSSIRTKLIQLLQRRCLLPVSKVGEDDFYDAWMMTMPRFCGFEGINPLTVYFCYRKRRGGCEGKQKEETMEESEPELWLIVLEVHNTFGESHVYLLEIGKNEDALPNSYPAASGYDHRWTFPRSFHVSPFNDRKGYYVVSAKRPSQAPPSLDSGTRRGTSEGGDGATPPMPTISVHLHLDAPFAPSADSDNETNEPRAKTSTENTKSEIGPLKLTAVLRPMSSVPLSSKSILSLFSLNPFASSSSTSTATTTTPASRPTKVKANPFALFLTFPRILYQAYILHYRKQLGVYIRPEPFPAPQTPASPAYVSNTRLPEGHFEADRVGSVVRDGIGDYGDAGSSGGFGCPVASRTGTIQVQALTIRHLPTSALETWARRVVERYVAARVGVLASFLARQLENQEGESRTKPPGKVVEKEVKKTREKVVVRVELIPSSFAVTGIEGEGGRRVFSGESLSLSSSDGHVDEPTKPTYPNAGTTNANGSYGNGQVDVGTNGGTLTETLTKTKTKTLTKTLKITYLSPSFYTLLFLAPSARWALERGGEKGERLFSLSLASSSDSHETGYENGKGGGERNGTDGEEAQKEAEKMFLELFGGFDGHTEKATGETEGENPSLSLRQRIRSWAIPLPIPDSSGDTSKGVNGLPPIPARHFLDTPILSPSTASSPSEHVQDYVPPHSPLSTLLILVLLFLSYLEKGVFRLVGARVLKFDEGAEVGEPWEGEKWGRVVRRVVDVKC
ncbi:hypothetical protein D9758_015227 [Tetrapyrgos nigripes]|uniref:Uncharacterized protein n=1 Tax=Tetrapyrgos nigripes TaxID=182062 RepID=A0A8H5FNQ8_9AGAR|nr:hypothetical protein D9758_015227 [Tetrapyrgos nigripes]